MTELDSAVAAASRRARNHWFSDGLFALGRSLYSVLLGLYFHYLPVLLAWPQWGRTTVFSLLMAIPFFFLGRDRIGYLFIAFGILYFIEGTTQLFRYLRQHPAPQA